MLAKYGELKGIKDALNKAMVTSCPITYRNQTRMLKSSFIRMCLEKRKTKVAGWTSGHHGYEMMYPQCIGCVTGELIAAGKDFPQPAYTEWIEGGECGVAIKPPQREPALFADMIPAMAKAGMITEKESDMKTKNDIPTGLPRDYEVFKSLPDQITDGLRIRDLVPHWRREISPDKQAGTCVNCGRVGVMIRQHGLCSSCQNAGRRKRGGDLLDALQIIRDKMTRPGVKVRSAASKELRRGKSCPHNQQSAISNEIVLISPLADVGERYIKLGRMMQDVRTSLGDLTAAAHELGMRINIEIEVIK